MPTDPVATHAALLSKIDEYTRSMDEDGYPATELLRALRAVVELHKPYRRSVDVGCSGCDTGIGSDDADWPCRTIRAVAGELGVDLNE